jgi:hypothetical protein
MAAKTADRTRIFEERVCAGYVLDDAGTWIPLADREKVEREVVANLAEGRILHDGRWLTFAEAKSAHAQARASAPPPEEEREETRAIEP